VVVLSKSDPSPLAPESDDEKKKDDSKKDDGKKADAKKEEAVETKSIWTILGKGFSRFRCRRRYVALQAGKSGAVFAVEAPPPSPGGPPAFTIHRFDLAKRKENVAIAGVQFFRVSFDGEKMLYQQGDKWAIADPPPVPMDRSGAASGQ